MWRAEFELCRALANKRQEKGSPKLAARLKCASRHSRHLMPRTIDYWFSLASPWAFLGHQAFVDLARQHGVTVHYKPVSLGDVFPHTGGIPLKLHPKHWPLPIALPDRTIVAVAESGADPADYVRRAMTAIWVEDRDL